jgi:hypothetical protein
MNKQELIEKIKEIPRNEGFLVDTIEINRTWLLRELKQLEPQKPVVPQFVADYIRYAIENDWDLQDAMNLIVDEEDGSFSDWFYKGKNMETFALAWINGYTVDKEKRYEVILSNGQSLKTVYRQGEDRLDFEKVYGDLERFTRKQLEDAGLAWVFDCPGVKVREVE